MLLTHWQFWLISRSLLLKVCYWKRKRCSCFTSERWIWLFCIAIIATANCPWMWRILHQIKHEFSTFGTKNFSPNYDGYLSLRWLGNSNNNGKLQATQDFPFMFPSNHGYYLLWFLGYSKQISHMKEVAATSGGYTAILAGGFNFHHGGFHYCSAVSVAPKFWARGIGQTERWPDGGTTTLLNAPTLVVGCITAISSYLVHGSTAWSCHGCQLVELNDVPSLNSPCWHCLKVRPAITSNSMTAHLALHGHIHLSLTQQLTSVGHIMLS